MNLSKPRAFRLRSASAVLFTGLIAGSMLSWQPVIAQDQPAAVPKLPVADPATAWEALALSARQKLQNAADPDAAMREVLADLIAFADRFPDTNEGAVALLNHGALAAQVGQVEDAEKSLDRAAGFAKDPGLVEAIKMQQLQISLRPGKAPPSFTASTLAGEKVTPAGFAGKVVLLDFWATWCGPCVAELPNVKQVFKEHHDEGFEIVSISLDRDEETLRSFIKEHEMTWTHVFNPAQPAEEDLAKKYGVTAIPTMILIGRDGKIAAVGLRGGALEEAVEAALAVKAPADPTAPAAAQAPPEGD